MSRALSDVCRCSGQAINLQYKIFVSFIVTRGDENPTFSFEQDEILIEFVRENGALYDFSNKRYSEYDTWQYWQSGNLKVLNAML